MEAISIRVPALLNHRDWDCEPLPLDQNCGRDLPSLPQCRSMRPYVPSHSVVQPQVPPVSSFFFLFLSPSVSDPTSKFHPVFQHLRALLAGHSVLSNTLRTKVLDPGDS